MDTFSFKHLVMVAVDDNHNWSTDLNNDARFIAFLGCSGDRELTQNKIELVLTGLLAALGIFWNKKK
jgi:hypothetical protein